MPSLLCVLRSPSKLMAFLPGESKIQIREVSERERGKSLKNQRRKQISRLGAACTRHFRVGTSRPGRRCCPPTCGETNAMDTPSSSKDGDDLTKGSQSWLRDLWSQKVTPDPPPLARQSSRTSLPVFFDRDGRVGPTALWLKEPHSLTALSMERSEEDAREAELARAAQVALEIAQASVLCHPYHRIFHRFTSLFQVFSRLTTDEL